MKEKLKNKEINLWIKKIILGFFIIGMIVMGNSTDRDSESIEDDKKTNTIVKITINSIQEDKGIEIGDSSRARGRNAIATGRNSISIGSGAVATGGNQTSEIIKRKLDENRDKLNEITRKEEEINQLNKELNDLKIKHHETIEAGIRVEEIMKAKENAKIDWKNKLEEYRQVVDENEEFFRIHREKINDLNSKLTGVSNLGTFNINNVDELTEKAREFKNQIENDTTLDLTLDFYKDYIVSYYKALGDLRENELILSKYNVSKFYDDSSGLNREEVKGKYQYIQYSRDYNYGLSFFSDGRINFGAGNKYNVESSNYYTNSGIEIDESDKPRREIKIKNELTDLSTLEEWNNAKEDKIKYLKLLRKHLEINNNFFLTQEIKDRIYELNEKKLDYNIKKIEITYYQKMYEDSGKIEISWLDKKSLALKELKEIKKEIEKKLNNVYDIEKNIDKVKKEWEKENVIDIKEKNKITTETLTEELERALGISRDAINEKEKEINKKKEIADQAERNYNGINPTEKDLILSREYKKISEQLKEKGNLLKTASERLQWLRDNLTLHDLNVGENAIAIGTNSLASGNSSIALGKENIVTKENAIGLGVQNLVTGEKSIGVGTGNNIFNSNSIGIGKENTLNGQNSFLIGNENTEIGNRNIIFGNSNRIYGEDSIILGNDNILGNENDLKNNNVILGSNINGNNIENAIVLGKDSVGISNTLSVGSESNLRKIVNVAEGEISNTSNEVITGKQLRNIIDNMGISNNSMDKKINLDGSNLNGDNIRAIINILSNGASLENPTGSLVDDNLIKNNLDMKIDKNLVYTKEEIDNKFSKKSNVYDRGETYSRTEINNLINGKINISDLDTTLNEFIKLDGSNIDDSSRTKIIDKLSENSNINNPTNNLITDKKIKDYIEAKGFVTSVDIKDKANINGSNINVEKYREKLSENSNLHSPTNSLITDTKVKNYIDNFKENELNGKILSNTLKISGNGKLFGEDIRIEIDEELVKKINSKVGNTDNLDGYIKYDNEENNVITLGKIGEEVVLKNISNPVDENDAVNRRYVDKISEDIKKIAVKGLNGVSNAISMSSLTHSLSFNEYRHQLGVGLGVYGGTRAVAIGVSGISENKRFNYKVSGSVNNKGNLAMGIGFGINIGEKVIKNNYNQLSKKMNEKLVILESENAKIKEENKKLMDKIDRLEEMILILKKEINNRK